MSIHRFPVVVVGDTGVGKTSLLLRHTGQAFLPVHVPTPGIEFVASRLRLPSGATVCLEMWDTTGQARFHTVARSCHAGSRACLLVFDLSRPETFDSIRGWLDGALDRGHGDVVYVLVGTKSDLPRRVPVAAITGLLADRGEIDAYAETSAKDGTGVEELFRVRVAEAIYKADRPVGEPRSRCH